MAEFLSFFDQKVRTFPMHLEIYYDRNCDWRIYIYKRGCADDYPGSVRRGDDAVIAEVQDNDMELCFAKAHVALKEWLLDNDGGY